MHLPDLPLISDTHFCKGGDVEIDPSAAIAPGVVIRAESGSRIIVSQGVCIGAGAIIQAYRGDLLLDVGVSLGAGTLILGHGYIGANTCVGSAATLINPSISASQVIASGALIGDISRLAPNSQKNSQTSENPTAKSPPVENPPVENPPVESSPVESYPSESSAANQEGTDASPGPDQTAADQNGASTPAPDQPANFSQVYGRRQIDQLLITLFPHRQPLNSPIPPDSS